VQSIFVNFCFPFVHLQPQGPIFTSVLCQLSVTMICPSPQSLRTLCTSDFVHNVMISHNGPIAYMYSQAAIEYDKQNNQDFNNILRLNTDQQVYSS